MKALEPPGRIPLSIKTIFCLNGNTNTGGPVAGVQKVLTLFDIFIRIFYTEQEIFHWIIKTLPLFRGQSGPAG